MKKIKLLLIVWALILSSCSIMESLMPKSYKLNNFINEGITYINKNKFNSAKDSFTKAYKIDENNPLVNNNLGLIYSLTGNHEKSFFHFNKALENAPNNIYYLLNLGVAYDKAKRYGLALEKYNKILKIKPDWIPALNNKAYSLVSIKKIKDAIDMYEKILNSDNKNITAITGLAGLYARMSKYDEALKYIDKAEEIKKLPELYIAKATIYELTGDYEKAKELLEYSYKLNPEFSLTSFLLGDLFIRTGDIKNGYKFFKNAVELSEKEEINGNDYIGGNYFVLAGISESITGGSTSKLYYQKAYKLFPQLKNVNKPIDIESILALSILLKNSIKLDKAEDKVKEILKQEPNNPIANNLLGDIYVLKADYGDINKRQFFYNMAITSYEKSIEADPQQSDVYVKLGDIYFSQGNMEVIYYRQGKYHQAFTEYRKALKINPNDPMAHLSLSLIYSAKAEYAASDTKAASPIEKYSKAITELTLARSFSQDNYIYDYLIAYLYSKIGGKDNYQKAEYFVKTALDLAPKCYNCMYLLSNITYKLGDKEKSYQILSDNNISMKRNEKTDIIKYLKILNSYKIKGKTIKDDKSKINNKVSKKIIKKKSDYNKLEKKDNYPSTITKPTTNKKHTSTITKETDKPEENNKLNIQQMASPVTEVSKNTQGKKEGNKK